MRNLLVFSCLLFTACTQTKYHVGEIREIEEFGLQTDIVGDTLPITAPGAFTISTYDTLLLISTDNRPSAYLDIYNLKTNQIQGTYCTKGQGPSEFTSFHHYDQYFTNSEGHLLLPAVNYPNKYVILNLSKSITAHRTIFEEEIPWRDEFFRTSGLFLLSPDTTLIQYPCYKQDPRDYTYFLPRTVLYVNGVEAKTYQPYQDSSDNPYFSQLSGFIYDLTSKLKPDHSKLVAGMRGADYLHIVDLQSGDILSVKTAGTPTLEQITEFGPTDPLQFYYMSVTATEDFIFALYINQPVDQFHATPQPGEIRIFDWFGNPKARLKLKDNLSWATFNPMNNHLYGLDYNEQIYSYDLSRILKQIR